MNTSFWLFWFQLSAICYLQLTTVARAQVQQVWIAKYNGGQTTGTNKAVALALDRDGNIVVSGSGTSTNGDYDYLTLKYSPFGFQLWGARYASPGMDDDQVRAMALDNEQNVYVTGSSVTIKCNSNGVQQWNAPFAGRSLAADTNGNVYVTGFSENDFATVKLNDLGSNVWLRTYDPIGAKDISQAITVDSRLGQVYVAGLVESRCDRFGCYHQLAVVGYDSTGNQLWATNYNDYLMRQYRADSEIDGLILDGTGNIYVTGNLRGASAYLTAKLTPDGIVVWSRSPISNTEEGVTGIALDNQGNIYLTGRRFSDVFYPTIYKTFKLDNNGAKLWEADYSGPAPAYHKATAIALDANANAYVTGQSPGINTGNDFATIKYDTNGKQLWVQRYDGPIHGDDQATAIAVTPNGEVYVAGFSQTSPTLVEMVVIKYAELKPIEILPDKSVLLQSFSAAGQPCRIQATTNFPNWLDLVTVTPDTNGVCRFLDTNAAAYPYRFYRAISP